MSDSALSEQLEEGLAVLGVVRARRMFGGVGVFLEGLMFGLIADGVLYLKVDDENRPDFEAGGLEPFRYTRKDGKATVMSYWRAPDDLLDDHDELVRWARSAHRAAVRSAARKPPAKKRTATKQASKASR